MPPLSLLIKPASGGCNMRCAYCFYHDEAHNRAVASYGHMSLSTLEVLIKKSLDYADGQCTFGFQGGEPTLRGLEFFQQAVEFQRRYNVKNVKILNAIQTNGLTLDSSWASFFKKNNFLIGLSLDGPKAIHDGSRKDTNGRGTFSRTMRAAQLLQSHSVDLNILTVVTRQVAENITQVYRFFRREDLLYQQYIPCLDPICGPRGGSPYSLTPELFAGSLKKLFDLWYQDVTAGRFIYVRYFENLLGMLLSRPPEHCGLSGRCAPQHVVEADGSVYPCDFYCLDQWRLGNILQDSFPDLDKAAGQFLKDSLSPPADCGDCEYFFICRGGCRRDREPLSPQGKNYFCTAYRDFFAYALPRLQALAGFSSRGQSSF